MEFDTEFGKIEINRFDAIEHPPNPGKYNLVVNQERLYDEFYAAFGISLKGSTAFDTLIIGSYLAGNDNYAVLDDRRLILLVDAEIYVLNIEFGNVISRTELAVDWPSLWSIYPFCNGFVIHGEMDIIKLDKNFQIKWTFSGADIWAIPSGNEKAFEICGDTIKLCDFIGNKYRLDRNGKQL